MRGILGRVICALDFPDGGSALKFVDRAGDYIVWYKVGLELYLSEGDSIISELKGRGKKIFLDLKLHDIPNTVAGAVRSIAEKNVDMFTVHALGGVRMIHAAKEAAEDKGTRVVAVTILTSLSQEDLDGFGYSADIVRATSNLAHLSVTAGADGIVCSPREVSHLKRNIEGEFIAITPGIRFAEDEADDQKRITTPEEAFRAGSDFIVMGRSLTRAADLERRIEILSAMEIA